MENKTNTEKQKHPNVRLKQAREQHLWTLEDVAKRISNLPDFAPGIPDPRTVARWERGTSFPSPRYCRALCAIFEMDAQSLELTPLSSDQTSDQKENIIQEYQDDINDQGVLSSKECDMPTLPLCTNIDRNVSQSLKEDKIKRYREHFLEQVRSFWIENVFEQSFQYIPYMRLIVQFQPEAVSNPWQAVIPRQTSPLCTFSDNKSIVQIYDEADGALLILGEMGTGKTTLLLALAQTLLARAEQDEMHAVPVILNLSFWTDEYQSLAQWCIEELYDKYQVKRELSQQWMENEQIILLLDGLDEVALLYRSACMNAINVYRREHSLAPLVICCRYVDYMNQPMRLLVQTAIEIQPLTPQQIDIDLEHTEGPLLGVRTMLRRKSSATNTHNNAIMDKHVGTNVPTHFY